MSHIAPLNNHNGVAHDSEKGSVEMEEPAAHQPGIQLTAAQYERLFFQPGGGPRKGDLSNPRQFGNPTALALISYLLGLTPTACILMSWDGTAPTSLTAIMGAFYFAGGMGMTIAGVLEWVLGNTFPFVVFTTFGGFWLTLAVIFDPSKEVASAFTDGTSSPAFNHGLEFFFIAWAVLCILYFIAALRTNVVFAYVFLTFTLTFASLAAAYREAGLGNSHKAVIMLKTAGACGFANIVGGWYLAAGLIMAAVNMPFGLPVGDLTRFLNRRKVD
ncbi:GPR1/FUN34/yaaH family-domain-containing protein [Mycena metata]|jgi:succinate-acetate transporter protein|uniref:GPR1/FUN34/yaaH family-domain-containing protein n=1 Tax=Mycena metata TaxID=1033252 RepID=A0AAD7IBK3_9AGAR|nr:GPR1/FUN34/yaaH family-domain-containing protein [Mycena metata]